MEKPPTKKTVPRAGTSRQPLARYLPASPGRLFVRPALDTSPPADTDEQISAFGVEYAEANMLKFIALVVEDDPFQRAFVADLLKDEGLQVVECASAEAAELVLAPPGMNCGAGNRCQSCRRHVWC